MKTLIAKMASEQIRFKEHEFFRLLPEKTAEEVLPVVAKRLTFWIMAFQDLLPLVEDSITDPDLKKLARHHREEDTGHNLWFFQDLKKMEIQSDRDVLEIFHSSNRLSRLSTYALMAEIYRLSDDRLRLALLMSLESSGHVFFGTMSDFTERLGLGQKLKYFAHHHIGVEKAHTVFSDSVTDALLSEGLDPDLRQEGEQMIVRTHEVFHLLFDEMVADLTREHLPLRDSVPVALSL